MRVLLVDDERALLVCLKMFLETPELSVDTAETLANAMRFIEDKKYDYIISDIRLDGVLGEEGLDLLKFVKQHKKGTKVIIITSFDRKEIRQKAYSLGADLFFEKPVSANELLDAMKKLGLECSVN
jgi:DNA-binding response OmpR family regulator